MLRNLVGMAVRFCMRHTGASRNAVWRIGESLGRYVSAPAKS